MPKSINKKAMKCNRPRPLRKGEPGFGKKKKVVLGCKAGRQKLIKYGAKGYLQQSLLWVQILQTVKRSLLITGHSKSIFCVGLGG